jgi:Gpi18-like mannosyltransferase
VQPRLATDGHARAALTIFVAAKLLVLWFGMQAALVLLNQQLPGRWLDIWNRWDAPHYVDIINDGYVTTGEARKWIVFFPLFPWIARLVNLVFGDAVLSAFFVSTLASLFAARLLYRLAALDEGEERARDAVFFLAVFPTSYFLHIGYTESLFLALSLGSFFAARRGKWAVAGIVGALAALSRVNGALLVPALALEAWSDYRRTRRFDPRWLWILFIGTGTLVYLALNKKVAGSYFAFQVYQRDVWNRRLAMPWVSIHDAWLSVWERPPFESIMVGWQELLFTLIAIAVVIWSWLRLRPSYALWATLNVLLWTSTGFLLSAPRYALTVFPIYLCFARLSDGRPLTRAAITIWSVLFLGFFTALFVTGKWAF